MDDFSQSNLREWSVTELSASIKRQLEESFGRVRVRGELGRVSWPKSGHCYFDVREGAATLSGVMWRSAVARSEFRPEEGIEVVVTGRLSAYAGQSRYQLIVESIEPAGIGAILQAIEKLRRALEAEGLFDPSRKKALPRLPDLIGVVTSPTGSVIQDIRHRLSERFPRRLAIWPVAVQGKDCAEQVAAAVRGFNARAAGGDPPRPDVIIIARGGGSPIDLAGFSAEIVVRAVADSEIPVISAVGHETDTTLVDFAADLRAPTPTAAAEFAVPVRDELRGHLTGIQQRLSTFMGRELERLRLHLQTRGAALPTADVLFARTYQRFDQSELPRPAALFAEPAARLARAALPRPQLLYEKAALRLRYAPLPRPDSALARPTERLARAALPRPQSLVDRAGLSLRYAVLPPPDRLLERPTQRFAAIGPRLGVDSIRRRLAESKRRIGATRRALADRSHARFDRLDARVRTAARLLDTLGYQATLRRGFAVVRRAGENRIASAADAVPGTALEIEFRDGRRRATVDRERPEAAADSRRSGLD